MDIQLATRGACKVKQFSTVKIMKLLGGIK
ncbi:Uncharacterised protein [Mycobacteroides abscessus subsp. abscessus]|nr:Uncharacterised protein [Mycobacteroides abscessus subsp. abscessus]